MVMQWIKTGLLVSWLFLGIWTGKCSSNDWERYFDKRNTNLNGDVKRRSMSAKLTFEIVASGPWGDGPNDIPLMLENYPLFGEIAPEQMRKIRAPVRIRLRSTGLHSRAGGRATSNTRWWPCIHSSFQY